MRRDGREPASARANFGIRAGRRRTPRLPLEFATKRESAGDNEKAIARLADSARCANVTLIREIPVRGFFRAARL